MTDKNNAVPEPTISDSTEQGGVGNAIAKDHDDFVAAIKAHEAQQGGDNS